MKSSKGTSRRASIRLEICEDRILLSTTLSYLKGIDTSLETTAVATGLFHNNSIADLVVGTSGGSVQILNGDGAGHDQPGASSDPLAAPAARITVASLNPDVDAYPDVAAVDSHGDLYVLFGDNNGGFLSNAPTLVATVSGSIVSLVAGKFFGDTHEDLAVLDNTGKISIYQAVGNGTFQASTTIPGRQSSYTPPHYDPDSTYTTYATSLIAGTFQMGETGLAVTYVARYEGTPEPYSPTNFLDVYLSSDPEPVYATSIFSDEDLPIVATTGKLVSPSQNVDDIAIVDGSRNLILLKNNGNGTFTYDATNKSFGLPPKTPYGSQTPISLAAGDFDGDGTIDLACLSTGSSNRIDLVLGTGNGGFVNSATLSGPGNPSAFALLALDTSGSGRLDLTVAAPSTITTFLAADATAKVISIDAPTTYEGDPVDPLNPGYETAFDFVFTLDSTPLRGSFDYQTRDGTARSGVDYQAVASTASFPLTGSTTFTIAVMVRPNYRIDPSRQFFLDLSNAQGIDLNGMTEASQTIIDDDSEVVNSAYQKAPYDTAPEVYVPDVPPVISLSKAILVANAMNSANPNPSGETITFNITFSDSALKVIDVYPRLPVITGKTHVNGLSQPGSSTSSLLAVGSGGFAEGLFEPGDAFVFGRLDTGPVDSRTTSVGSSIEGLEIVGMRSAGIVVDNGQATAAGVVVNPSDSDNLVTIRDVFVTHCGAEGIGLRSGAAAVIHDTLTNNGFDGIKIQNSHQYISDNTIQNNAHNGILIGHDAANTLILDNTIEANALNGISVLGSNAKLSGNTISGNLGDGIFTNALGASITGGSVTNSGLNGIEITGHLIPIKTSDFTTIKDVPLIAGNDTGIRIEAMPGVTIRGNGVSNNRQIGIALVKTSQTSILNYVVGSPVGIRISSSSKTVIGDPNPGGSGFDSIQGTEVGIWIEAGSTGNVIQASEVFAGTDGIRITGSSGNLIGVDTSNFNNQISARDGSGISITGGSSGNLIQGSEINGGSIGINLIDSGGNTIGRLVASDPDHSHDRSNTIEQAQQVGISIQDGSDRNFILGNYLFNNNVADIVISGSNNNQVLGNAFGSFTYNSGYYGFAESYGIILRGGAEGNVIGYADGVTGDDFSRGNVFNGGYNGTQGILMIEGATGNKIFNNNIQGTWFGVRLVGASDNQIGQSTQGENPGRGYGNTIIGGQQYGLAVTQGSSSNEIAGNLITRFATGNVTIDDSNSNRLFGNWIGPDETGASTYPENLGVGVVIRGGSTDNRIGGATDFTGTGLGNVISGNQSDGILVTENSRRNFIAGNIIGLDAPGKNPLPNYNGIEFIGAPANQIGDAFSRQRNLILGNRNRAVVSDRAFG